ncbi:MAG: aliphatic sulfonate ABC transporter substrate-binding protein [Bacteroidota bacterium]
MKICGKLLLILPAVIMLASGCGSEKKGGRPVLRVGFFPNITHVQALLGKNSKFSAVTGCDIEWKKFNAGSTEIEAMMAGELDMGYIGPGPAINGYIKTRGEIQIIAGACGGGAVLVSRRGLKIKSASELKNKRIAIPQFGNTQHIVLKQMLDSEGLKETTKGGTVEIVQAENPDVKTLFDRGEIDAAFVPEPWASRLILEAGANIVLDYNQVWRGGKYPVAVLIARKTFIQDHPEIVQKFLRAHIELSEAAVGNRADVKKTINDEIRKLTGKKLSEEVMNSSFSRLFINYEIDKQSVLDMSVLMSKLGIIREKPDMKGIFDLKYMARQGRTE